jgi:hypothetical protein
MAVRFHLETGRLYITPLVQRYLNSLGCCTPDHDEIAKASPEWQPNKYLVSSRRLLAYDEPLARDLQPVVAMLDKLALELASSIGDAPGMLWCFKRQRGLKLCTVIRRLSCLQKQMNIQCAGHAGSLSVPVEAVKAAGIL